MCVCGRLTHPQCIRAATRPIFRDGKLTIHGGEFWARVIRNQRAQGYHHSTAGKEGAPGSHELEARHSNACGILSM